MTSGAGENQNNKYILLDACGDFVLLVRNLGISISSIENNTIIKETGYYPINLNLNRECKQAIAATSRLPRKSTMCLRPKIFSALKTLAGVNASIAH